MAILTVVIVVLFVTPFVVTNCQPLPSLLLILFVTPPVVTNRVFLLWMSPSNKLGRCIDKLI